MFQFSDSTQWKKTTSKSETGVISSIFHVKSVFLISLFCFIISSMCNICIISQARISWCQYYSLFQNQYLGSLIFLCMKYLFTTFWLLRTGAIRAKRPIGAFLGNPVCDVPALLSGASWQSSLEVLILDVSVLCRVEQGTPPGHWLRCCTSGLYMKCQLWCLWWPQSHGTQYNGALEKQRGQLSFSSRAAQYT